MFNYFVLIFPLRVILKAFVSLFPAVVDLIAKLPVTFNVPVAPAYLPVPPLITAFPVIAIVVGASASSAQALADESNETLSVLPPPLRVPEPLKESHWLAGAAEPIPCKSLKPSAFVPAASTEVT